MNLKEYKLISGACKGADLAWESIGEEFGLGGIQRYTPDSYDGLNDYGKELVEENYKMVCASLERPVISPDTYSGKLVRRNMMIALKARVVFAIGHLIMDTMKIEGGTGYGVELAILLGKPTFIYDQYKEEWFRMENNSPFNRFVVRLETPPRLSKVFAGIGTRKINEAGLQAIKEIYRFNTLVTE